MSERIVFKKAKNLKNLDGRIYKDLAASIMMVGKIVEIFDSDYCLHVILDSSKYGNSNEINLYCDNLEELINIRDELIEIMINGKEVV